MHRVIRIREDKPALQNLLQKGSVGDELWNSLLAAERELEGEVMEVVTEANSFLEQVCLANLMSPPETTSRAWVVISLALLQLICRSGDRLLLVLIRWMALASALLGLGDLF